MAIQHLDFDTLLENWYTKIYQFCFLVTTQPSAADDLTFQTFLYAGSESAPATSKAQSIRLFTLAWKTCEDYFYRKMRKHISRSELTKALEKVGIISLSDDDWKFLKESPSKKAACFLFHTVGLDSQEVIQILGGSCSHTEQLAANPSLYYPEELISKIPLKESLDEMSDRIYLRFEQRNVSLENHLRNFRLFWDKSVIWIALAIILLFAAAAYYTASI